jgi:hypothetical protein
MAARAMQIFKTRPFTPFARGERIADSRLKEAIERAGRRLIDADFGGRVIKQRVARPRQGRPDGCRVLIAYCSGCRVVFLQARAGEHGARRVDDPARIRGRMASGGYETNCESA